MNVTFSPFVPNGVVKAPASKSAAHRMLILAALADGESTVRLDTLSEDIEATVRCLTQLGAGITQSGSVLTVKPIQNAPKTATLDCGESGSTLRFLLPVAAALGVSAILTGHGRLPERPMGPLVDALKKNGVKVSSDFPIQISGKLHGGDFTLTGNVSSQFFTGLALALTRAEKESTVRVTLPVESESYMRLTLDALRRFGVAVNENGHTYTVQPTQSKHGDFTVEGDWSNAAALLCLGANVTGLDLASAQGDRKMLDVLRDLGAKITVDNGTIRADLSALHGADIDAADIPDLVPALAAVAATANGTTRITGAARLRLKESDRIETTCALINTLGGSAEPTDDGLIIRGKRRLCGGTVSSFGDHRIVMAAAVLAQNCETPVTVTSAQAINKSYPGFFEAINSIGGDVHVLQLRQ